MVIELSLNIDNRHFMYSTIPKIVTEIENMISEVVELQKIIFYTSQQVLKLQEVLQHL